jgi:hypothetical protein
MENEEPNDAPLTDSLTESIVSGLQVQEQPGGRVLTMFQGAPVEPKSIQEELRNSFASLCAYYGWLGPLAESAIYEVVSHGAGGKACVTTPWGSDEVGGDMHDAEKHAAYVAHVKATIAEWHPWLWPMFDSARASLRITPSEFSYCVKTRAGVQFDIHALRQFAALTPFAEPSESAH